MSEVKGARCFVLLEWRIEFRSPWREIVKAVRPAPGSVASGTVLRAWTAGRTLNGRLLKPLML
ncbi:hypothetical protein [Roseicella aerolata]|uniref:Uncharacterized protein n=1 Tax=Roseicella aerolata TaxID=2883479 RepID=A0A9X1IBZ5_9PROT|nr:hypothetical protein [Roseicella aerolata]MCB4820250.1 hypothetical protein [Roseicella aerolata]